jgi:hypothetical protein
MTSDTGGPVEPLRTVKQAAAEVGIPYFKLARAIKGGLIPHYTLYNSRRLVRVSEVLAVIDATREGATDEHL